MEGTALSSKSLVYEIPISFSQAMVPKQDHMLSWDLLCSIYDHTHYIIKMTTK